MKIFKSKQSPHDKLHTAKNQIRLSQTMWDGRTSCAPVKKHVRGYFTSSQVISTLPWSDMHARLSIKPGFFKFSKIVEHIKASFVLTFATYVGSLALMDAESGDCH